MKIFNFRFRNFFTNFLVLFFALFLCLMVIEFATRIFWAAPEFRYPQTRHRKHPVLGWEMIPNQEAYTFGVPVTINSNGLRGEEFRIQKDPDIFRILILGDSFTFGVLLRNDQIYPTLLKDILKNYNPEQKWEVINGGVQRYSLYQELDYLKLKGLQFNPDLVIIGFVNDDIGKRSKKWERDYERSREKLASLLWEKVPFLMFFVKNSALVNFLRDRIIRLKFSMNAARSVELRILKGIRDNHINSLWQATRQYLAEVAELGRKYGFKVLLVAFPATNQIVFDYPNSIYPAELQKIAKDLSIPFVDLFPVFKENYTGDIWSLYYPYDPHPNALGHRLAAEAIFEALVKYKMISQDLVN